MDCGLVPGIETRWVGKIPGSFPKVVMTVGVYSDGSQVGHSRRYRERDVGSSCSLSTDVSLWAFRFAQRDGGGAVQLWHSHLPIGGVQSEVRA